MSSFYTDPITGETTIQGPPITLPGQEEYLPDGTLNPKHPGFEGLTPYQLKTGDFNHTSPGFPPDPPHGTVWSQQLGRYVNPNTHGAFPKLPWGTSTNPTDPGHKPSNTSVEPNPIPPQSPGTVQGRVGNLIDTIQHPQTPPLNPGTGGDQGIQNALQNYNPLSPYNPTPYGGQGSMGNSPFQPPNPSGGTMQRPGQGFYKSLPNYDFYNQG